MKRLAAIVIAVMLVLICAAAEEQFPLTFSTPFTNETMKDISIPDDLTDEYTRVILTETLLLDASDFISETGMYEYIDPSYTCLAWSDEIGVVSLGIPAGEKGIMVISWIPKLAGSCSVFPFEEAINNIPGQPDIIELFFEYTFTSYWPDRSMMP